MKVQDLHVTDVEMSPLVRARLRVLQCAAPVGERAVQLWSEHDLIVDHSNRCGVTTAELPVLLRFIHANFPVVNTRLRPEHRSTEVLGLALDESRYIWCSVMIADDPTEIHDTCIADETSAACLLSMLEAFC